MSIPSPQFTRFQSDINRISAIPINQFAHIPLRDDLSTSPPTLRRCIRCLHSAKENTRRISQLDAAHQYCAKQISQYAQNLTNNLTATTKLARFSVRFERISANRNRYSLLAFNVFKHLPVGDSRDDQRFQEFQHALLQERMNGWGTCHREILYFLHEADRSDNIDTQLDILHRLYLLRPDLSHYGLRKQIVHVFTLICMKIYHLSYPVEKWKIIISNWIARDYELTEKILNSLSMRMRDLLQQPDFSKIIEEFTKLNAFFHSWQSMLNDVDVLLLFRWKRNALLSLFPQFGAISVVDIDKLRVLFSAYGCATDLEIIIWKSLEFPHDFFEGKDKHIRISERWQKVLATFARKPKKALYDLHVLALRLNEASAYKQFNAYIRYGDLDADFLIQLFYDVDNEVMRTLIIERLLSYPDHESIKNAEYLYNFAKDITFAMSTAHKMISKSLTLLQMAQAYTSEIYITTALKMLALFFPFYLNLSSKITFNSSFKWSQQKSTSEPPLPILPLQDTELKTVLNYLDIKEFPDPTTVDLIINLHLFPCITDQGVAMLLKKIPGLYISNAFNIQRYSNIKITTTETDIPPIYVHMDILCFSEYFAAMAHGASQEATYIRMKQCDTIVVPKKEYDFFIAWMPFVYDEWEMQKKPRLTTIQILEHLQIADFFGFESVCAYISFVLYKRLYALTFSERETLISAAFPNHRSTLDALYPFIKYPFYQLFTDS